MSKEDKIPEYLKDLSKLAVGGSSVPSASGLIIIFKLPDLGNKPEEAIEKYEGKSNKKFYWKVNVSEIKWHKDAYREILEEQNAKKLEYIEGFEVDKESIMKLSPTATKMLSQFILDEKITGEDDIKYLRLGTGRDTQYKFKKNE